MPTISKKINAMQKTVKTDQNDARHCSPDSFSFRTGDAVVLDIITASHGLRVPPRCSKFSLLENDKVNDTC